MATRSPSRGSSNGMSSPVNQRRQGRLALGIASAGLVTALLWLVIDPRNRQRMGRRDLAVLQLVEDRRMGHDTPRRLRRRQCARAGTPPPADTESLSPAL